MCISSPSKSNKPFCSRLKVPNAGSLSRVTDPDTSTAVCVSGVSPCVTGSEEWLSELRGAISTCRLKDKSPIVEMVESRSLDPFRRVWSTNEGFQEHREFSFSEEGINGREEVAETNPSQCFQHQPL